MIYDAVMYSRDRITYFACPTARSGGPPFGIKYDDRFFHIYAIGKTGTGKSTLLETLIAQDVRSGDGFAFVDPHGDLAERLVNSGDIPNVTYLNVPDHTQPYGWNPLRHVAAERRALVAGGILEVFRTMWPEAWGVRMEHILRNALLALLEQPSATLPDILRLLRDKHFRRTVASRVSHEPVRTYWTKEFRPVPEFIAPVENKVGAFLADPAVFRILVEPKEPISFRRIMDEGRVLLVNLAKGQIGPDSARVLGGLLVTTIGLAAFSRADTPADARRPFFLFVDEFQEYTTLSIASMLSELRKFRVGLVLAHQYLDQLSSDVRGAVLGNAGTVITFRIGPEDARLFAGEFGPHITALDLVGLPNREIYLKLMIDGAVSPPFSARTITSAEALAARDAALGRS